MNLRVALFRAGLICLVVGGVFGQRRRPTIEDVITVPARNASPATASIAGTVVSEATALPLAGAIVTLSPRFENAILALISQSEPRAEFAPIRTDDSGKFLFERLPAGEYGLAIRVDGYVSRSIGESTEQGRLTMLTLAISQRIEGLQVALTPSARIRGHARDESGQPLANIPVQLFLPTSGQAAVVETMSSTDGSFDLVGFSPGVFVLVAGSPTAEPVRSFALPVVIVTTDVLSQQVSLTGRDRYSVRGRITTKDTKEPPASVGVTVQSSARMGFRNATRMETGFEYDAKSGTFEIPALLPGFYRLDVDAPYGTCGSVNIVVSSRDISDVALILSPCLGTN